MGISSTWKSSSGRNRKLKANQTAQFRLSNVYAKIPADSETKQVPGSGQITLLEMWTTIINGAILDSLMSNL